MITMKNIPAMFLTATLIFAFLSAMVTHLPAAENPGLIIAPTRVVFEGRDRSQIVRLVNPDSNPHSYRLSLVNIRMDDHGTRKIIDSPDSTEALAASMVRFAPRQVTIPPEGWQTVRLMVRKPADLAAGEYRVHLKVASMPDQQMTSNDESESPQVEPGKVGIRLDIVMDVTIPLIIRHGQGDVSVSPLKALYKPGTSAGGQAVEVALERSGSRSLFADVVLFSDQNNQSAPVPLGEIKGIAIYTPNTIQYVSVPLRSNLPGTLQGKTIRVEIRDRDHGDTLALLSSKKLQVE